ncbi:UvrD-helicase domain-containing protein|uniref:DNA 3'-5' helicase n=1 Tax=Dendrosporobacter quercicolus TaxID=146817 RepID=A0A1G9NM86_9FIRM|nr:UvrD-helicase domain-containing protein [Dendrosporobacter quercicolus]NSL47388.1 UvrD-helicase domain-containing protein [Dendrosporobacter quercicolus DSM 1736]SDL87706.1 DNA helicase-2 / ATP-dependent DNA helicase PcrA [Dendrosporobacter quercicolus]
MSDILAGLNEQQRQAVTTTEGFIRVIAGAGSGKTRALSHRFAYLVNEIGIMPANILCVTFTNKSANEMKQRIRRLTGDSDTGYISTFHSFCVAVLQEDINAVQYPKRFLVLDNADIDAMLKIIYEERGLTLRHMTFAKARDMIEIRKIFKDPEYYEPMIAFSLDELQQRYLHAVETDDIIFWGYLYQQKKYFGLDYNDLIKYVLHIFSVNEAIRLKWQQRLEYIMIDEYQDIDELQYRLMKVLCAYHKNLFIVGDPDQTIYTWRGASVRYILDFDKEFPNVRTLMMMANYRSTPQIVAVANSLIGNNKHRMKKDLLPVLPDGAKVVYHHAKTAETEAKWIAAEIKELIANGVKLGDIAILYRAHYISRMLEEVLLKEEVPYKIYSGVQFFGRMEIKDALSYLRLIAYKDDLSFLRVANVPKRNIGERRMKFLQDYAGQNRCSLYNAFERTIDNEIFKSTKAQRFLALIERFSAGHQDLPVSELLNAVLDQSGYEVMLRTEGSQERLDNLAELKQSVYEYEISCGEECTLEDYLAHVALLTNTDALSGQNAVKLMTVHTAKGLEFPHVFLCGLEEGVFPSRKTATLEGMEEERRLAFVAFTRAKKALFITDAEGRNFDGSYRYPSRFIFNVDKTLLAYTNELEDSLVYETNWNITSSERMLVMQASGPVFKPGDRVVHSIMGAGAVVDIDHDKAAYVIKFDDLGTVRKINFKAKLEAEGAFNG